MRICSDQPCIVLLTEKDVWIRVNGKEPISLKANHMALLNCENNIIDVSSLNNTLVAHISHDIIKDYLRFLNKDLSQIPVWQRSATPILTLPCLTPDVFRVAAQHSMMPAETESEKERTRALLFTVLSRFLDSKKFLSLMMYMLRNCVSDSVYQIIESDIHKDHTAQAKQKKDEREEVLKEIRQLENRKKILENKQRNEERRVRTRRLIERGAILEGIFPLAPNLSGAEVKAFLIALSHLPGAAELTANLSKSGDTP